MPRWLRIVLILLLVAAGLYGVARFAMGRIAATLCEVSVVIARVPQPSAVLDAVVYAYNCGATTGFATHVALVPVGEMPSGPGNVFVADTDHGQAGSESWGGPWAKAIWTGADALTVEHDTRARLFTTEARARGVAITFAAIERPN